MNLNKILISGAVFLVLGVIAVLLFAGSESAERVNVRINDRTLNVRVADNPWERRRGLSGQTLQSLQAEGMLFVFPDDEVRDFWMKDMNFSLDVLWIRDGKIMSIDYNVQPPTQGGEIPRMTSRPLPADMVLEVPAGTVQRLGLMPGMSITVETP